MDLNESKIIIKNAKGKEKEYYKLFTFDSEETNKSYIVYTDYSKDKKGNTIVRANTYDPNGENLKLEPLTDDKEWKVIEKILETMQEKLNGGNESLERELEDESK